MTKRHRLGLDSQDLIISQDGDPRAEVKIGEGRSLPRLCSLAHTCMLSCVLTMVIFLCVLVPDLLGEDLRYPGEESKLSILLY